MKSPRLALGFPVLVSSFFLMGAGARAEAVAPVVGESSAAEVSVTLAAAASGGSVSPTQAGKQGACAAHARASPAFESEQPICSP